MLAALQKAVQTVVDHSRSAAAQEVVASQRVVRGALCSAIVQVLAIDFYGRTWWGGQRHLWEFFRSYLATPSVTSLAALSLAKVLREIDENHRMCEDPSVKLRSFVCAAINRRSAAEWFARLSDNADHVCKWFGAGAVLMDLDSAAVFLEILQPLSSLDNFDLALDYEFTRGK